MIAVAAVIVDTAGADNYCSDSKKEQNAVGETRRPRFLFLRKIRADRHPLAQPFPNQTLKSMNPMLRPKRRYQRVQIEYAAPKVVPAPVRVPVTSNVHGYRLKRSGNWQLVAREPHMPAPTRKERFVDGLSNVVTGALERWQGSLERMQDILPLPHSR